MKFDFEDIFITGANGWLGRQLVHTLVNNDKDVLEMNIKKNIKIHCLIQENENDEFLTKFDAVKVFRGDLRVPHSLTEFIHNSKKGLLIHTAGVIHPNKTMDFYKINYIGTKNLVKVAIKNNINKIVVISSNSPIGCNPNNKHFFTEASKYNPYMNYGKSKEMMEKYLLEEIKNNVNITILRPPWFYGENMPKRQNLFYKMVIAGTFPVIGSGNNVRSIANVKNICQAILLSSIKNISKGKIYWIADDKSYTMNEILETIKAVYKDKFNIHSKKNIIRLPYFFGQLFQFLDYLIQKSGNYSQKIHVLSELNKNIACDISLAINELDYKPKINLYEGTYQAIKKHNKYVT